MVEKKEDTKEFQEIPINNPFIRHPNHWDPENEVYDKVKVNSCVIIDPAESSREEIFFAIVDFLYASYFHKQ